MIGVCLKYMMRNYGSQLQARATIKVLEDMGLKYEILQYNKKGIMFKLKALPRIFNPVFINDKLLSLQKRETCERYPKSKYVTNYLMLIVKNILWRIQYV